MLETPFEIICGLTGHLIPWAAIFGRRDRSNRRDHLATFVGILFWAALGVGVWLAFFR